MQSDARGDKENQLKTISALRPHCTWRACLCLGISYGQEPRRVELERIQIGSTFSHLARRSQITATRLTDGRYQPQRGCGRSKPRVARNELPWVIVRQTSPTPSGLWPFRFLVSPTPLNT